MTDHTRYDGTFTGRLVTDNLCESDGNGYGFIRLDTGQDGAHGTTKVYVHASTCSEDMRTLIDRERHDEVGMRIRGSRPGSASVPSRAWDLPEHLLVFEIRPRKRGPRAVRVRFVNETTANPLDHGNHCHECPGEWADMIDLDARARQYYDCD